MDRILHRRFFLSKHIIEPSVSLQHKLVKWGSEHQTCPVFSPVAKRSALKMASEIQTKNWFLIGKNGFVFGKLLEYQAGANPINTYNSTHPGHPPTHYFWAADNFQTQVFGQNLPNFFIFFFNFFPNLFCFWYNFNTLSNFYNNLIQQLTAILKLVSTSPVLPLDIFINES